MPTLKRLLSLWLTLLAAYWLARAAAAALLFGRIESGWAALVELAAIPLLQAAALTWITRRAAGARAAKAAAAGAAEPPASDPPLASGPPPPYRRAPRRPRPGGGETS
jgi:hypothetical protein